MSSIKTILFTSKTLKNGKHPVMLYIFEEKRYYLSLGESAYVHEFDQQKGRFKRSFPNAKAKNFNLRKYELKANEIVDDFVRNGERFSFPKFKQLFKGEKPDTKTFYQFFEEMIEEKKTLGKAGTMKAYKDAYVTLKRYHPKDFGFEAFNYTLLKGLETSLFARGNTGGGIGARMRSIKATSLWWILRSISTIIICTLIINMSLKTSGLMVYLVLAPCLFFVGGAIRSLGNQFHDGIHNNISNWSTKNELLKKISLFLKLNVNNPLNDLIVCYVIAPIMFYDHECYKKEHLNHHKYLGQDNKDDEKIKSIEIKFTGTNYFKAYLKLLITFLIKWSFWKSSVTGDFFNTSLKTRLFILGWWGTWGMIALLFNQFDFFISLFTVILLARMTTYHFIKVQAELADHYGKESSSIISYTRTLPKNGLSYFFHPDNDNYHILHHLFPEIPMPNLPKAHKLLMDVDDKYQKAEHLESYFVGANSLAQTLGKILIEKNLDRSRVKTIELT